MDVESYLERIGYHGPRTRGAATLAGLQRAHLLNVPFDALDCYLGNPVGVEPESAYEKVVSARRGGFCFELNGLFGWLLEELGFEVTRLAARPLIGTGDRLAPPFAHLVLLVELERRWLVDVGFGAQFALEPLDLDQRAEQPRAGLRFRLSELDGGLLAQAVDSPDAVAYRVGLEPVAQTDFTQQCHEYATDPDSIFVRHAPVARMFGDGWVSVTRERLAGSRDGERLDRPLAGDDDWREQLRAWFGLDVTGRQVLGVPA